MHILCQIVVTRANIGQPFVPPSQHLVYHGPPPPPPPHLTHLRFPMNPNPQKHALHLQHAQQQQQQQHLLNMQHSQYHPNEIPDAKQSASEIAQNELWSSPTTDTPKIVSLDVKCEKKGMKVYLQFDKPFYGIVFSKGKFQFSLQNVNLIEKYYFDGN